MQRCAKSLWFLWPGNLTGRMRYLPSAQMDESIKEIVRMLLRCAYGSPLDASSKIPSHSACVEVAVRENAFNPLSSPSTAAQPDERIYVAFQQHITFQVGSLCWPSCHTEKEVLHYPAFCEAAHCVASWIDVTRKLLGPPGCHDIGQYSAQMAMRCNIDTSDDTVQFSETGVPCCRLRDATTRGNSHNAGESQHKVLLQGTQHSEHYEAKHESSLIYEGGTLSYDPNVYGGKFQDRYHIKTLQVSLSCTTALVHHACFPPAVHLLRHSKGADLAPDDLWLRIKMLIKTHTCKRSMC